MEKKSLWAIQNKATATTTTKQQTNKTNKQTNQMLHGKVLKRDSCGFFFGKFGFFQTACYNGCQ